MPPGPKPPACPFRTRAEAELVTPARVGSDQRVPAPARGRSICWARLIGRGGGERRLRIGRRSRGCSGRPSDLTGRARLGRGRRLLTRRAPGGGRADARRSVHKRSEPASHELLGADTQRAEREDGRDDAHRQGGPLPALRLATFAPLLSRIRLGGGVHRRHDTGCCINAAAPLNASSRTSGTKPAANIPHMIMRRTARRTSC